MPLNEAQTYRELVYPMNNLGEWQRIDRAALQAGQYLRLVNMVGWQEMAIRSRNGYQDLTPFGIQGMAMLDHIHSLARLSTENPDPAWNFLYVGRLEEVYRLTSEVPPVVVPSADTAQVYATRLATWQTLRRWSAVAYKKGYSGRPYLYLASSGQMKKDPLNDTSDETFKEMVRWGIDRPVWAAQAAVGAAGNLVSTFAPYSYVFTLRNPITGHEGNPSPVMMESLKIWTAGGGSQIAVTVRCNSPELFLTGTQDLQLVGDRNMILYRAGGSFSDSYYRRVAALTGPNGTTDVTFTDNVPDLDIAANPIAEFDNDRPVTSALRTPFYATIAGYTITTPGSIIVGEVQVDIAVEQGLAAWENQELVLAPGTLIRVGGGTDHEEFCTVGAMVRPDYPFGFFTVFQVAHAVGESIQTASRANTGCRFSALAFNSVFLAGDYYNPNVLYKSKTGRPESFPVVNEADGAPGSIEVGSPSNPIMNITEFGGYLLSLNKSKIYVVQVYNGAMQDPQETHAQRGLFASWAWCKADNEIYYLAYDGIYAFSGGQSIKKSEQIDHIFKGEYSNGFYPISLSTTVDANEFSDLDKIQFWYEKNDVFVTYVDTEGTRRRLRYSTVFDRWSTENVYADAILLEPDTGHLIFSDLNPSNGIARLNHDNTPVSPTIPDTTDGWTSDAHDDGDAISWEAWLGWMFMGQPAMQKQFGDLVLELANPDNDVTVEVYYDFAEAPTETFTVVAEPTKDRYRIPLPLNCGLGYEAYAISVRLTGAGTQPTSLYTLTFHYLTLEEIQRGRPSDWDNLGHPHDKRLTQLSLEHDSVGTDVTLNMDVMYGISGNTEALAVQTFTLSNDAWTPATGPRRSRPTFPINLDKPIKLVRLRPTMTTHDFKNWTYHFEFIPYPPDKCLFTEWDSLGYPCDKLLRELILEIDTGDIACRVDVQADGLTKRSVYVKTNWDSRHLIVTLNQPGDDEIIGRQFRLMLAPGTGGKCQLFKHSFNAVREPCANTFWSSYEQSFGYNGYKFIKQMWIHYRSCAEVTLRVWTDDKQLLYEVDLPQHDHRDVERVYFPVASVAGVLNKSKVYTFDLVSLEPCCPLYLFADATRVEWMPVGADMRQGYQQVLLSQGMERTAMP